MRLALGGMDTAALSPESPTTHPRTAIRKPQKCGLLAHSVLESISVQPFLHHSSGQLPCPALAAHGTGWHQTQGRASAGLCPWQQQDEPLERR